MRIACNEFDYSVADVPEAVVRGVRTRPRRLRRPSSMESFGHPIAQNTKPSLILSTITAFYDTI